MKRYGMVTLCFLVPLAAIAAEGAGASSKFAGEFAKRWAATRKMAVGVAEAMPPAQYAFKPDPGSMSFGEQMSHIALINYAFCYALKDAAMPQMPAATAKEALVKYVGDSFEYCQSAINTVTEQQLDQTHRTPDGQLTGREVLLALYVHMAHHRGQAEVYLRDKGIAPPSYVF